MKILRKNKKGLLEIKNIVTEMETVFRVIYRQNSNRKSLNLRICQWELWKLISRKKIKDYEITTNEYKSKTMR
jgi:hypothetical protein